jgi:hypothetical protein
MLVIWNGRGAWVIWLVAIAAFLPLILLRQIEGPEVDRAVAITMGLAAVGILALGLRWNRGATFDVSARANSLWGIPMQLWALPVALFAILLGTGVITTAEDPPVRQPAAPATTTR